MVHLSPNIAISNLNVNDLYITKSEIGRVDKNISHFKFKGINIKNKNKKRIEKLHHDSSNF